MMVLTNNPSDDSAASNREQGGGQAVAIPWFSAGHPLGVPLLWQPLSLTLHGRAAGEHFTWSIAARWDMAKHFPGI